MVFAYTVKGRGLATEGHPSNHSVLLTEDQLRALAEGSGVSLDDRWATFAPGTAEAALCQARATALRRPQVPTGPAVPVPRALGHPHRKPVSTQAVLGRLLADRP